MSMIDSIEFDIRYQFSDIKAEVLMQVLLLLL